MHYIEIPKTSKYDAEITAITQALSTECPNAPNKFSALFINPTDLNKAVQIAPCAISLSRGYYYGFGMSPSNELRSLAKKVHDSTPQFAIQQYNEFVRNELIMRLRLLIDASGGGTYIFSISLAEDRILESELLKDVIDGAVRFQAVFDLLSKFKAQINNIFK